MKAALALMAAAVLTGCSTAANGEAERVDVSAAALEHVEISMQRLPCFGTCPVYSVSIRGDGTVTFTGEQHVMTRGTATRTIDVEDVASLLRRLEEGGYFSFADNYTMNAPACGMYHTDAPRAITVVRTAERTKRIEHDFGCSGAPAALRRLQDAIDRTAGTARWIGPR